MSSSHPPSPATKNKQASSAMRLPLTVTRLSERLCTAILVAAWALPPPAMAGRPGTPDEVQTWVRAASLDRPPEVCVRFHNTAKVNVGFFVDWLKNGQRLAGKDLQGN